MPLLVEGVTTSPVASTLWLLVVIATLPVERVRSSEVADTILVLYQEAMKLLPTRPLSAAATATSFPPQPGLESSAGDVQQCQW